MKYKGVAAVLMLAISCLSAPAADKATKATTNKRLFVEKFKTDWDGLNGQCKYDNGSKDMTFECANAAIVLAGRQCVSSGRFFQKAGTWWQVAEFGMLIASAGFTGVGASATIANAKVFSTLGGSTGLGAVTSTIKSNSSGDQAGLSNVNSTWSDFTKFLSGSGAGGTAEQPSNLAIYRRAIAAGAACEMAATGSNGSNTSLAPAAPSPTPSTPTAPNPPNTTTPPPAGGDTPEKPKQF
jgi:hypothetical protein